MGIYDKKIIGFIAIMPFPLKRGAKRVHRLVVLPEYQGLGIGTKIVEEMAKIYINKGWDFFITTSNKGLIKSFERNKHFKLASKSLNEPVFTNKELFNEEKIQKEYNGAFRRYIYSFKTNKEIWG